MRTVDRPLPTSGLVRDLTPAEAATFWRDGAVIVRGVLPADWVAALRAATDDLMADPKIPAVDYAGDGGPRFFSFTYAWKYHETFRDWALRGPLIDLTRQVLPGARSLNLFFDQIFAREAGSSKSTPFHQDEPYTPLAGSDHWFRHWVPLDVVTGRTGAVHYLRGSHRGPIYRARSFDTSSVMADRYDRSADFLALPDFAADYAAHDWLIGEVEPGDVILHHPGTVHGSLPATDPAPRRAVTTIYADETVRWHPHPGNAFHNDALMGHQPIPDLAADSPIDCDLFPRVWSAQA
ncbi:MAG TPA: phytanoyl-CoA dioxygenase family protein [Sporichthyaceae bacterium]|jgi:ectoine hydroxylase-related dioxygenase (phytanoyl-CoA dioxygenase family)|nr:phytanoyl-CoA dioxygenase family protein [Sporichthyaceae bacterium]